MRAVRAGAPVIVAAGAALGGCQSAERWSLWDTPPPYERGPRHEAPAAAQDLAARDEADIEELAPLPAGLPPEGPITLTIEEAALLALEGNRDLRVQRLSPGITATFEEIERGVYDPEVFARGTLFEDEAVEISRATGERFSATRDEESLAAGVRQALPSGTDLEASFSADRATSNRTPEQQVVRAGLTLTQALLRGFGPAVNLASVRQAELQTLASLYELQGFTEVLLAETESAYWRYALALRRIEIFQQSLELARRQQEEVESRIEIGVLPQTEAATVRAEVAQREQDLIDARSLLQRLKLQLLRLVDPRSGGLIDRDVAAASDPAATPLAIDDLAERIDLAVQQRPELNEARLRLDQERLETIVTRNGVLPRLDFFIVLGKTGYADSFSDALSDLDGPTYDLTAGLDFSYPLGNRSARGRDEGARLSRRQAAEAVANLEQRVRVDVGLAAVEVERARQQITATSVTRALREEAVRAETERLRVGDSTSLLVAQAQRDLLESQIDEVDAVVLYRLALIQLHLAEGTLLARRGLSVVESPR